MVVLSIYSADTLAVLPASLLKILLYSYISSNAEDYFLYFSHMNHDALCLSYHYTQNGSESMSYVRLDHRDGLTAWPQMENVAYIACLHDQSKSGFFWRAGFFPDNQSFLNTFSIAVIGWIKAGPSKKPLLF